ncbi:zinc ribbon domain-containing protein [Halarchaeum nitratireducens]|uniref:Zinc-ribbon domain-containing protein n=1 Tax=Halarchaeum nitratireducens TaxID=489913 RepID=A0A830G784_9EURY|nr:MULTISPECIES: zinc ribbon domain-containing protein [Halarchaeum]MBP2251994.1 hypothetical protein [Halarchaeum solikamskense]GGN05560.1 hypothetical protein GCM10009021_00530 [Halarchaeum nitratireducens]
MPSNERDGNGGPDERDEAPRSTVYCRGCGAEISEDADICPECGVRQPTGGRSAGDAEFFEQYSTLTWLGSALVTALTFPVGLLVPAYFAYRAKQGTGVEQGRWEVWAVLLGNVIGIAAVELAGETGAKVVVILELLLGIFVILAGIIGAFVLSGAYAQVGGAPLLALGV